MKKILIASVLKPVDDIRHFRKLANSLAKANKYEILIIGKGYNKKSSIPDIRMLGTGYFGRMSLKRLKIQGVFIIQTWLFRPNVVLLTTPELFLSASILRPFLKFKMVWDVQEDYQKNLKHQKEYTRTQSFLGQLIFEFLFWIARRNTALFLLAENVYQHDISLGHKPKLVLENKCLKPKKTPGIRTKWSYGERLELVFTGTLSDYSGVSRAVTIFRGIKRIYPGTHLKIIGVCPQNEMATYLRKVQASCTSHIQITAQRETVNHETIVQAIGQADLGIIGYTPDKVNENRIPTKLYEYTGYGLPFIYHDHTPWRQACEKMSVGMPVNLYAFEPKGVLEWLQNTPPSYSELAIWNKEEKRLQEAFYKLLN